MWTDSFRAGYRLAMENGYPPGVVIWGMPRTERIDDPPVGFDIQARQEARDTIRRLPGASSMLEQPVQPGMFYLVASRSGGRFKGTFVGALPIPSPDDVLPMAVPINPPRPDRN